MVKASALYLVIVFALIIGLICAALLLAAYVYRAQDQQIARYGQLRNNSMSGVNIIMADPDSATYSNRRLALFWADQDSVLLSRLHWGIFDLGIARAYLHEDTISQIFTFANGIDSSRWAALYVNDEDRSIGLAGASKINGDAYLPKAGISKTYIYDRSYEGTGPLVSGRSISSNKTIPPLDSARLKVLESAFGTVYNADTSLNQRDSITVSYLKPTLYFSFVRKLKTVKNVSLRGNIILKSDSILTIDSSVRLENVLIFAKAIVFKEGFHGSCQAFAADSVSIQKNCTFTYPSCIGIVNLSSKKANAQAVIAIGERSIVCGTVFTYQKNEGELLPTVILGKNIRVEGQLYSQGFIRYHGPFEVYGSLTTRRFVIQKDYNFTENVLLDVILDPGRLSSAYLGSILLPQAAPKKQILQWFKAVQE